MRVHNTPGLVRGEIAATNCADCGVQIVYNGSVKIPPCPCKGRNPKCPNPSTEETDFVSGNSPVAGTVTRGSDKATLCGACLKAESAEKAAKSGSKFGGMKGGVPALLAALMGGGDLDAMILEVPAGPAKGSAPVAEPLDEPEEKAPPSDMLC